MPSVFLDNLLNLINVREKEFYYKFLRARWHHHTASANQSARGNKVTRVFAPVDAECGDICWPKKTCRCISVTNTSLCPNSSIHTFSSQLQKYTPQVAKSGKRAERSKQTKKFYSSLPVCNWNLTKTFRNPAWPTDKSWLAVIWLGIFNVPVNGKHPYKRTKASFSPSIPLCRPQNH